MQIDNNIPEVARRQIEHIAEVCERIKPLVVIRCITYNHEPYLRDALESFTMQKTNFPFVAIVHEDASTDGTAAVLCEYAERYPDIILPIYEEENQYSKRNGSLRRIMNAATKATGAKYIALCEGDDYWTHEHKLQKQVDFLESHPDYSMCFHNATVHYENGQFPDRPFAILESREYEMQENIDNWIIATASLVFLGSVYESRWYKEFLGSNKFVVSDLPLIMCCFKCGKCYCLKDSMSVYRLQPGGWTQQPNRSVRLATKLIEQELELQRIFGGYFDEVVSRNIAKHSRASISLLFQGNIKDAFRISKIACKYAPIDTIIANVTFVFQMLINVCRKK